ncbi:ABC transporter permease subunit [Virgibacillus sp. DJP39]|uniref:ABC transporter permease subunit n=1 Tax=Virgibacillus sp. DJP39 TaxID=3409790 RepID=UPI003BB4A508
MRVLKLFLFYLLGIVGILAVSILPVAVYSKIWHPVAFFDLLYRFAEQLFNPQTWMYSVPWTVNVVKIPLLEVLWGPYLYSMQILLAAVAIGLSLAFIMALTANFSHKLLLNPIKRLLDFLESVPDLVIAILLQMLSVYVYKTFAVDIFKVATIRDEKAYLGPIITLSILPMVSMFKILLLMIEQELLKDYVSFLQSKGIKKFRIITKHVLKNIMPSSFHHMKLIIWATLSSQFVIERLYNIKGLSFYLVENLIPITIAISLIMIFTPFYFFFQIIDLWINPDELHTYSITRKQHWWKKWQPVEMKGWLKRSGSNILYMVKKVNIKRLRPWRPIISIVIVIVKHLKNWKFVLGCLYFIFVISYSVIYSVTTDEHIEQIKLLFAEDGSFISAPPHEPTEPFLLGSDQFGYSILDQIVVGAKYTLICGLVIAVLRVVGGLMFGTFYAFKLNARSQQWISKMVDSIHFIPLSVIAYILLKMIIFGTTSGFSSDISVRIGAEVIILTILVIPLTTVLVGKDINRVLQNEFILSAKVLGGSKFHIFWRHVIPHIGPRMTILFGQQFIQVLLILIHLGVYNIFLGGTVVESGLMKSPPKSITYDWSGLIATNRYAFQSGKFFLLAWVLLAFMLSIFAMQLIIQGVKEVQQVKVGVIFRLGKIKSVKHKKRHKEPKRRLQDKEFSKEEFQMTEPIRRYRE